MLTNFLLELIKVFDGYTSLRKRLFRKIPCLLFKQKFKNLSKRTLATGCPTKHEFTRNSSNQQKVNGVFQ